MNNTVSLSQLKKQPGRSIDTVLATGDVIITRHGHPVAVIIKVITENVPCFPSTYLQWFASDVIAEVPVTITRHGRPVVSIVKANIVGEVEQ